eukprot:s2527_g6.t1
MLPSSMHIVDTGLSKPGASSPSGSPTQLPPVKTPKEKKSRPAPLTALTGCQASPVKDGSDSEARLVFDLSAMGRGPLHSGSYTPSQSSNHGAGQLRSQQLPLMVPSGPGSSGAFTSASSVSEGFEDGFPATSGCCLVRECM